MKANGRFWLAVGVALAAGPAWADNATIPYATLAQYRTMFNALPAAQRDKLMFVLAVQHRNDSDHAPIHMWVDHGSKRTEIPVGPDGTVSLPDRPDWIAAGVAVQTDQPHGSLNLGFDMWIKPPAGKTTPVSYVLEGVQQANDAMRAGARKMGGYLAMLAAPSVHSISIKLAGCCDGSVTISSAAGKVAAHEDKSGIVAIEPGVLRDHADGTITASAPIMVLDLFPN
jgi:hypothetical protein